jgi:WD40 repeat protein
LLPTFILALQLFARTGAGESALAVEGPLSIAPQLVIDPKGLVGDEVKSTDISSDGRFVAAAAGKEVRIWDVTTGSLVATLRGYREADGFDVGRINVVRFVPHSHYLAVGITDNTQAGSTRIYDLRQPDRIHELVEGHLGCTQNIAISPDGLRMITFGCDGNCHFLEWSQFDQRWRIRHTKRAGEELLAGTTPLDAEHRSFLFKHGLFAFAGTDDWFLWVDPNPAVNVDLPFDTSQESTASLYSFSNQSPVVGFKSWPTDIHQSLHRVKGVKLPFADRRTVTTALDLHIRNDSWLTVAGHSELGNRTKYWAAAWDGQSTFPTAVYSGHRSYPTAVSHSPTLATAVSGDKLGEVHVWKTDTGKSVLVRKPFNKQLYRVAWSQDGSELLFADTSFPTGKYQINKYGPITRRFHLSKRFISAANADLPGDPSTVSLPFAQFYGNVEVYAKRNAPNIDVFDMHARIGDRTYNLNWLAERERFLAYVPTARVEDKEFGRPYCYRAISLPDNPSAYSRLIVGSENGQLKQFTLEQIGPNGSPLLIPERRFVGHTGAVSSISISPDGQTMATSSWDGTIRLWKLRTAGETGDVDFLATGSSVTGVQPGSEAARSGIQLEDIVVSFDGKPFFERYRGMAEGKYRPGDQVEVELSRPYQTIDGTTTHERIVRTVTLQPSPEIVEPYLTIFFSDDGEWIAWTPRGFYDASPQGEQYVGWHVNRQRHEPADFFGAGQFAKHLYRPDVITQVVQTGDEAAAVRLANAPLRDRPIPPRDDADIRQAEFFAEVEPPTVEIVAPAYGARINEESVVVETRVAAAQDLPVQEVNFRVNGRPVPHKPETVEQVRQDDRVVTVYRQSLDLDPGDNVVTVEAENRESTSGPRQLQVHRTSQSKNPPQGKLYVLAIGISNYQDPKFKLSFAHKDASDFVDAWKRQAGRLYSEVEAKLVTDRDATVEGIKDAMQWLSENARNPQDTAVIFLAGHGLFDDNDNWYFGSVDLDPRALFRTGVSEAEVGLWISKQLRCKSIFFADTCHAGAFQGMPVSNKHAQGRDVWRGVAALALVSCLAREESVEHPDWGNGAFTKALLSGLECTSCDADRDGHLSFDELSLYVKDEVPKLTRDTQHPAAHVSLDVSKVQLAHLGR